MSHFRQWKLQVTFFISCYLILIIKNIARTQLMLLEETKMQRKMIQFTTNVMANSGIYLHSKDATNMKSISTWKLTIISSLFTLAMLSTAMVSITNTDNFYAFINPSPYVAASMIAQGGVYFIYHYRKLISEMFYEMDQNLYTYPDEHLIHVEYPWYMEEGNFILLMAATEYLLFFFLFLVCLPAFGELIYYRRIRTFIYPSWMPWKVDSLKGELIKFAFQLWPVACGIWFSCMIMTFQLVVIVEFMRQYERLVVALKSLRKRTSDMVLQQVPKRKDYDRVMKENIIHCIRHHQLLHKNFHPFQVWFSRFFSLELTISVITFAFALYVMINASSLTQVLTYFIAVLFIWINFLTRCFVSEIFSRLDENLSQTVLWEVEWLHESKTNRRLLLIFHQMACRPLRLFGLSVFEATPDTFTKLVRITYSIFNVLNSSMKK